MPTSTKTSKTKPPTAGKPKNKNNRGRASSIGGLASRLARSKKGGRARKSSKRGLFGIAAGAGRGTRARKPSTRRRLGTAAGAGVRFRPRKPSRTGLIGIAAGAGLGGAAMATRRRNGHQAETANWPPVETSAAATQAAPTADHHANDPSGGAEHGTPKGPNFADAA
jgi:hypothetical protein